jgi:hypothetical protein
MIFGNIVNSTSKQSDNPIGRARAYFYTSLRATIVTQFSAPFGRFLALDHGQLNSLPVLETNFAERLKDAVFVKSFDGFCHGYLSQLTILLENKVYRGAGVLSNSPPRRQAHQQVRRNK